MFKYVAFEDGMGGFVPREAGLVCSRRFGDCKDMASILTAMNRAAGIPAYFTWLGTRDLPYTFSGTPFAAGQQSYDLYDTYWRPVYIP